MYFKVENFENLGNFKYHLIAHNLTTQRPRMSGLLYCPSVFHIQDKLCRTRTAYETLLQSDFIFDSPGPFQLAPWS